MAVTGAADPTGCGEGFSYIRVPNKPMATKVQQLQNNNNDVYGKDNVCDSNRGESDRLMRQTDSDGDNNCH